MSQNYNKNIFKQIFREHWVEFQGVTPEYRTEYYDGVIAKMLGCGDQKNGFMSYQCVDCGATLRVPFSCKSSFCLSCAKIYTDEWADYIGRTLFKGVKYRHVVLTVPERLRNRFEHNADLLSEFMRVGHAFFQDVVSGWLKEEVEVGSVVVLQTSGRSGSYNPHLHIICTSGGITRDGCWKEFGYIDFNLFHKKWQYYLLKMLKEQITTPDMADEIDRCYRDYPQGFVAYIEKGAVPKEGRGLAHYLAKYVVSPPISLKRIIEYDGRNVRYWYNDHTTGQRMEAQVDVLVFIGRMVQHILPKGFQRIRYYGLQATCRASRVREQIIGLKQERNETAHGTYQVTGYRERIKKSFGLDPLKCSRCEGEMKLSGIWHPKYGWIKERSNSFIEEEAPVEVYDDG